MANMAAVTSCENTLYVLLKYGKIIDFLFLEKTFFNPYIGITEKFSHGMYIGVARCDGISFYLFIIRSIIFMVSPAFFRVNNVPYRQHMYRLAMGKINN